MIDPLDAKIIELYGSGMLIKEITEQTGVSKHVIQRVINRHKIPRRDKRIKIVLDNRWHHKYAKHTIFIPSFDKEEFIRLWNSGILRKDIAKQLDINEFGITHYVNEFELQHRKSGRPKNHSLTIFLQLSRSNISCFKYDSDDSLFQLLALL